MCGPGNLRMSRPPTSQGTTAPCGGGQNRIDHARAPQYTLRFPDAGQPSALWRPGAGAFMDRSNHRIQVQWSSAGSCDLWPVLCAARRAAKAAARTPGGVRDFDEIIAAMSVGRMPRMKRAAPSRFSGAGSQ
jgi:hypothetical protein